MTSEGTLNPLPPEILKQLAIVREQSGRIRDLKGFRKSHQVPSEINDHANSFVGRIAALDISDELDSRFAEFRKHLGLKRNQMTVFDPEAGIGRIQTPAFDFQVVALQSPDDPSEVRWRRILSEISSADQILSPALTTLFGSSFDRIETPAPKPIDVAESIDLLEEQPENDFSLDYDRQTTWFRVISPDKTAAMHVTADCISFVSFKLQSPGRLLEAFARMRIQMQHFGLMTAAE